MDRPLNILFLCTGNSARSILAEALMNRLGAGRSRALGFADGDFRSKPWDEFAAPGAPPLDFVITVCDNAAGEICPAWPGQPITAHWGVPDPAAATGSDAEIAVAFREAARLLRNRIELLLALPVAALDRMSLQARVRDIGETADSHPA